jgi:hypothetical protein
MLNWPESFGMPAGWKKAQVQANLRHLSLSAETRYHAGLRNVEFTEATLNRHKTNDNGNPNHQKKLKSYISI